MTNTGFKAMNNEELAMIAGGKLDIEYDKDDNYFQAAYKVIKSNSFKEVLGQVAEDAKGLLKETGIKIMYETGKTANNVIYSVREAYNKFKSWF